MTLDNALIDLATDYDEDAADGDASHQYEEGLDCGWEHFVDKMSRDGLSVRLGLRFFFLVFFSFVIREGRRKVDFFCFVLVFFS